MELKHIMKAERADLAIGLDILSDSNITHAIFEFHGGGDSGEITDTHLVSEEMMNEDGDLAYELCSSEFIEDAAKAPMTSDDFWNTLDNLIEGNYTEYDWWNNEGGGGYLALNLKTFTYYVHYEINGEDEGEANWDDDDYEPEYSTWNVSGGGVIEI